MRKKFKGYFLNTGDIFRLFVSRGKAITSSGDGTETVVTNLARRGAGNSLMTLKTSLKNVAAGQKFPGSLATGWCLHPAGKQPEQIRQAVEENHDLGIGQFTRQ